MERSNIQYPALQAPFDLILFAGQSNMAGRGDAAQAPACPQGSAWEYRAVTAPETLFPVQEPFGFAENRPGGIDDGTKKRGGMAAAFLAEYTQSTLRQAVAVSASEGGTTIQQWAVRLAPDAADRLQSARHCLAQCGLTPAHIFAVWSQGESDGDAGTAPEKYRQLFLSVWQRLQAAGAQQCFVVETGHFNTVKYPQGLYGLTAQELDARYGQIRTVQRELCRSLPEVHLAASFEPHLPEMRDEFHYYQSAYNTVGRQAARAAAQFFAGGPR